MHTTADLLDGVKARHALPSDYRLARFLGVTDNTMYNYRHGKSRPDDRVAMKLAELLELEPSYVLTCLAAERAPDETIRQVWTQLADRLQRAGVALAVILSLGFWTGGPDGGALASTLKPSQACGATPSVYYVNRLILQIVTFARRWLQKRTEGCIPASLVWGI